MGAYQMKDLGYPRTLTDERLIVTFSDGSRWAVPVQAIADSRDGFYAKDHEDTIGFIRKEELPGWELLDWAAANMNWSDVQDYAVRLLDTERAHDYQREWPNASKEISDVQEAP